ncbi:MAG: type I restriction enzyme HsdR N-terminal domain-containing protein [Bacteroidota bacterium]
MADEALIFPAYDIAVDTEGDKQWVYDVIRRKWVVLQPEEWVRQHLVHYLVRAKGVSPNLVSVEKEIRYRELRKRFDVVVFDRAGKPFILCEVKAPDVPVNQDTLNQIARYNESLQAPHLLLTNGRMLAFFSRNAEGEYVFQANGWWE